MRVKIFKNSSEFYLENDIDDWLQRVEGKVMLCEYLQSCDQYGAIVISIFYEEIKEEK